MTVTLDRALEVELTAVHDRAITGHVQSRQRLMAAANVRLRGQAGDQCWMNWINTALHEYQACF